MVGPSSRGARRKLPRGLRAAFSGLALVALVAGTAPIAPAEASHTRCRPSRFRKCPAPARKPLPVRGGTLVVALTADPGQLNPAITTSGVVHPAAEPMFNGLVSIGEDSKPVGELAESWRIDN
ncbi:MAG: hypothetical protein ABIW46_00735, partial [Acidimicrobiales bacterium]